jgi:glucoamylase
VPDEIRFAPGWPGIEPRWTTSAKSAVGTTFSDAARVWFTASHGILNEIYYPEVDTACTRDGGFLVSAGDGFFSEEKRHCEHEVSWLRPGVPAFRLTNTCLAGRYRIRKTLCCAPDFDAVLQHVRFTPLAGALDDYHLTWLLSPHLGNRGAGNTAWLGEHKGVPLLLAQRDHFVLAVASTAPWVARSVGFVGASDAWGDVRAHGRLTNRYDRAENGNVAVAGEIDLEACDGEFVLAIGFGHDPDAAALHARAALLEPFGRTLEHYAAPWRDWQRGLLDLDRSADPGDLYRSSASVIKTHMSLNSDGGIIASLSIPWGNAKGDDDLGGYHLVWPRDMVEAAGGLLAAGAGWETTTMLRFLVATQEPDGHWPQNMWLNGCPFWNGIQLDEAAFPILLVDLALREGVIRGHDLAGWWPMMRLAAGFVLRNGPATQQDRWEEDAGYSPFTIAVEVAALLAAAEAAETLGQSDLAAVYRDTADDWNEAVERWTFVTGTDLAREAGVNGYYVRIGLLESGAASSPLHGFVPIKNRPGDHSALEAADLVSADALALVRFGLRDAHDPRIRDTVRVIDHVLRVETTTGPTWHRYNEDGYGERDDGSPFAGTGTGRGWPLLAGERAHFELAAGNRDEAVRLAAVMRAQASPGGLLPEQVWDAPDKPELELLSGRPSGSAMPLVWAHAEYVKLLRSLRDGRVFDCPPQARARYVESANTPRVAVWRLGLRRPVIEAGRTLRIDTTERALVHWTVDDWQTTTDSRSHDVDDGLHVVELPTASLAAGRVVRFTFYWPDQDRWLGEDCAVRVVRTPPATGGQE